MLIPHNRGERQSFELSSAHIWATAGAFILISFLSGFFYEREQLARQDARSIQEYYENLAHVGSAPLSHESSGTERDALEAAIRSEYEARIATISAELSQLYDLEKEVREITGLATLGEAPGTGDSRGGKGGGQSEPNAVLRLARQVQNHPPELIYGLSRPSADLILQEIDLRKASFRQLLWEMEAQRDRIARVPSGWPSVERERKINSKFGYRRDPFTNRVRHHGGLDIAADYGDPVRATAKGRVSFAGSDPYYGNHVVIDHGNGITTLFAHLSSLSVKEGAYVERGSILGRVGSTGRSTSPHIHYEVHLNGQPVDPARYIGGR